MTHSGGARKRDRGWNSRGDYKKKEDGKKESEKIKINILTKFLIRLYNSKSEIKIKKEEEWAYLFYKMYEIAKETGWTFEYIRSMSVSEWKYLISMRTTLESIERTKNPIPKK